LGPSHRGKRDERSKRCQPQGHSSQILHGYSPYLSLMREYAAAKRIAR
jgi:hypothetical protein